MATSRNTDGIIRLALALIGLGFVFAIYQYLITNPIAKAQITTFLTNTEPIVFGVLILVAFIIYAKLNQKYASK